MSQVAEESGAQLLSRYSSKLRPSIYNLDVNIFPNNGPNPKEIAEISGETGVGKTTILMHIMARVILPSDCGGKDAMVVFILTDHTFEMHKFKCVLKSIINNFTSIENNVENIVATALHNITIIRCFSEFHFDLAVYGLDDLLMNNRYSLLAMDSIGAFCWTSHKKSYMKELFKRLIRVVDEYQINFVYSKPAYFRKNIKINERVDYIIEVINKPMDSFFVKIDLKSFSQSICRNFNWNSNGIIVFNE